MMPPQDRLAGHLRLLGIFWVAISALRLLFALGAVAVFVLVTARVPIVARDEAGIVALILPVVGVFLLTGALVGLLAGWGLLERRPWARTLAVVMGCLGLLDLPLGTALGVYTLWVLLPSKSEDDYRQIAREALVET
jgi:hypothetical protein